MKTKGMIFAAISASLFGALPILTKLVYETGLDAISLSFYRYAFLIPVSLFLCCKRKILIKLPHATCKDIMVYGSFFTAITALLLNYSYTYINTGVATTLHFLYPLFVIVICKVFYQDKIDRKTKISLCIMCIGIACFLENFNISNIQGILLALGSGITYAIYLVQMEKKRLCYINAMQFSFHLSLYVCILLFIVNILSSSFELPTTMMCYIYLISISVISLLALLCLQYASRLLGSKLTSLFSLFEPITSIMLGTIILGEQLYMLKLVGCILILFAVLNLAIGLKKQNS